MLSASSGWIGIVAAAVAVTAFLGMGTIHGTGFDSVNAEQTTITRNITITAPSPTGYSLLAQEPQLSVTPTNHTFTVPFDVKTLNYSLSLAYDQQDSYAWLYSNDTQWVFSGRSCGFATSTITTNGSTITTTTKKTFTGRISTTGIVFASQVPCGDFPGEWWAVNGSRTSDHVSISPSQVQMTVQPSSFPAHYSGKMNATLDVQMPPGNYALFLAVHVQEPGSPGFGTSLLYLLYYMPVVSTIATAQGSAPVIGSSPTLSYVLIAASAVAIATVLLLYTRRGTKPATPMGGLSSQ